MPTETAEEATGSIVIDFATSKKPMRNVEALRFGGAITDDKEQSDVQMLKRLNRALFADFGKSDMPPDLQDSLNTTRKNFRETLRIMPYDQLVESGAIHQLLDKYLEILVESAQRKFDHLTGPQDELTAEEKKNYEELVHEANRKIVKYSGERESYESDYCKDMIKDVALRYKAMVKHSGYLSMPKIVALSGVGIGDTECVGDLTNDVMAVQAARSLKGLLSEFATDELLQQYGADTQKNAVRIDALAKSLWRATAPLASLGDLEPETTEVDRIMALKLLESALAHAQIVQATTPEERLKVERATRAHLAEATHVALSLADDFLNVGPAKDDQRTLDIRANLKREAKAAGFAELLPMDQALAKASSLARSTAAELRKVAGTDQALIGRIESLVKTVEAAPSAEQTAGFQAREQQRRAAGNIAAALTA